MKCFGINVEHMADREQRFVRDCERNEAKHPELVAYLRKLRPLLLDIVEQYRKIRVEGWNLANVRYTFNGGVVAMVAPSIGGEPISEYIERVFSILALAIEEVIMCGFQRNITGSIGVIEIPRD